MSQRKILFKAKRTDNGEWVEGYLWSKRTVGYTSPVGNTDEIVIDPETVCQYTELADKNGKKIFEGDLVKLRTGRVCKVAFRNTPEFCGFDLLPFSETEKPAPKFSVYDGLEVIDNIHDN